MKFSLLDTGRDKGKTIATVDYFTVINPPLRVKEFTCDWDTRERVSRRFLKRRKD